MYLLIKYEVGNFILSLEKAYCIYMFYLLCKMGEKNIGIILPRITSSYVILLCIILSLLFIAEYLNLGNWVLLHFDLKGFI